MKIPKFDIIASKDKLRPILTYLLITKDNIVTTDTFMLVKFKTSLLFTKEFISAIPEQGILIESKYLKLICNKTFEYAIIDTESKLITFDSTIIIRYKLNHDNDLNYPNYAAIIPKTKREVLTIGIDSLILAKINAFMQSVEDKTSRLKFTFCGENKSIVIEPCGDLGITFIVIPFIIY